MITTVCKISYGSQTVPPIVPAVQGDTGRAISFEIADFTPPAGATATYFILKPSGEAIYNSATITDNSILCELTAQSLAEAGENRMQVRVLQGEDIVTSFEVILMVRTFLGDDAMESGTEMNIFDQAVAHATEDFQTNAEQIVEEVIESIPSDYTALTEEVDELNERLSKDITDINTAFDFIADTEYSPNLLPPITESGRYDLTTGLKTSNSDMQRTPDAITIPDGYSQLILIPKSGSTIYATILFYRTAEATSESYIKFSILSDVSTPSSANIPSGAKYFRMYCGVTNNINNYCFCVGTNRTFYEYGEVLSCVLKEDALPQETLQDIADGVSAFSQFAESSITNNILPPAQENGYFTGTVGEEIQKAASTTISRTPEPIPFESFDGEYKIVLRNAITGGGFVQIFFLASDKKTIVFTNSFNAGNGTSQLGYVPSTAKYFMLWASKGSSDFKLSDVCISKVNIDTFEPYQEKLATGSYLNYNKISEVLNGSKNIVVFGDSIFGMVDDETGVSNIMRRYTNANIINCAFGGTRLTIRSQVNGYEQFDFGNLVNCVISGDYSPLDVTGLPMYYPKRKQRLSQVDFTKVDTVLLFYGTNDYMSGVTKQQILDCATYIKALQTQYPQINVIYCSPAYRVWFDNGAFDYDSNTYNPATGTLVDFCDWFEELAKSINIQFIDCYNIGINEANCLRYFTPPDGTHHNANGRAFLGEYLGRRLLLN